MLTSCALIALSISAGRKSFVHSPSKMTAPLLTIFPLIFFVIFKVNLTLPDMTIPPIIRYTRGTYCYAPRVDLFAGSSLILSSKLPLLHAARGQSRHFWMSLCRKDAYSL